MRKKKAYLVGIKGVAMTALAVYLKEKGYEVCGSDIDEDFTTDRILKRTKIQVFKGFTSRNISKKYDLVVSTGAHGGMTNPEVKKAKDIGIPTYIHGEYLGKIMQEKKGISVAGCHGKTTTSSLVASLLSHAGFDPSYAIGTAEINDLGPAGHYGLGSYFVAEADEYMTCPATCSKPRFLWQSPKIIIITNIEHDHPDAYGDIEDVKKAFLQFVKKVPSDGAVIACIDNQNVARILPFIDKHVVTYGFSPQSDFRIEKYYFGKGVSFMNVGSQDVSFGEFMLKIAGRHNLLNALAAGITANLVGLTWDKIKKYLKKFCGTKRRFEKIGEYNGMILYDDYAHHPSEIVATLKAFRTWFQGRKMIVIFQPHTFSRTKVLLPEFAKAFLGADLAIITDIYPSAREKQDATISSEILVNEANKFKKNAFYGSTREKVMSIIGRSLSGNDLIITMGAGDIYKWHKDIISLLCKKISKS